MVGWSADLACATSETETGSVLVGKIVGVCGSNNGLRVTVSDLFGESLTCKIRVEVGVDWHLGVGMLSVILERKLDCVSNGTYVAVKARAKVARARAGAGAEASHLQRREQLTGRLNIIAIAGSFDSKAVKRTRWSGLSGMFGGGYPSPGRLRVEIFRRAFGVAGEWQEARV
jgi:hypothetical protein